MLGTVSDERLAAWHEKLVEAWIAQWQWALDMRGRALAVLDEGLVEAEGATLPVKERLTLASKVLAQVNTILRQNPPGASKGAADAAGGGSQPVSEANQRRMARLRARMGTALGEADGDGGASDDRDVADEEEGGDS